MGIYSKVRTGFDLGPLWVTFFNLAEGTGNPHISLHTLFRTINRRMGNMSYSCKQNVLIEAIPIHSLPKEK
jgi:hypothetical protein